MKKIQQKYKIYNIQDKTATPPQTKPYGWQTLISHANQQIKKNKGFGENVSQLSLGIYVTHLNVSLFYVVSQQVVSSVNMSHLFVKD
jgi:hypothetical protein